MRRIYSVLPNVTVAPLHFAPEDISGDRLLAMMKVDTDSRAYIPRMSVVVMHSDFFLQRCRFTWR
jgi:hypothetical protein